MFEEIIVYPAKSLLRKKGRSILAILGVAIGVCSVIIISSIGSFGTVAVNNELDSVTIICDSSTAGDALSTIAFAYGLEKGKAFIESVPNTEAVFVTKEGKIICTPNVPINSK